MGRTEATIRRPSVSSGRSGQSIRLGEKSYAQVRTKRSAL
jgi:hypothetical protein